MSLYGLYVAAHPNDPFLACANAYPLHPMYMQCDLCPHGENCELRDPPEVDELPAAEIVPRVTHNPDAYNKYSFKNFCRLVKKFITQN